MLTKEKILIFLKENKSFLQKEYAISRIGLFGSFAIGENTVDSDIDILISFKEEAHNLYENKAALRHLLGQAFKRDIDICSEKYIKPYFKKQVLNTAIYV